MASRVAPDLFLGDVLDRPLYPAIIVCFSHICYLIFWDLRRRTRAKGAKPACPIGPRLIWRYAAAIRIFENSAQRTRNGCDAIKAPRRG